MVSFGPCFLSQGSFDSSILETMCLSNVKILSVLCSVFGFRDPIRC